jgi:histidine triad (HIT) family protein
MNDCIFCKIINKEIPAQIVYEDEHTLAFLDRQPNNHGHTLVVPKEHFESVYSTPDEAWARVMLTAKKMAITIKNALDADGLNIAMNNEEAAGQEVMHAHVHVIPRFINDGEAIGRHLTYKPGEAEAVAEKIKAELK